MRKFLQEKHVQACHSAQSFAQLAEIALEVIGAMPRPIGQVCGPISTGGRGTIEANLQAFREAINWLTGRGEIVFDQMPFESHIFRIIDGGYNTRVNNQLLNDFYGPIFTSGMVTTFFFIPGWESSHGATWEHEEAQEHRHRIVYLHELGFPG